MSRTEADVFRAKVLLDDLAVTADPPRGDFWKDVEKLAGIDDAPFRLIRPSEADPLLWLELPLARFPAIWREGRVVTYAPLQAVLRRELSKVLRDWIQQGTTADPLEKLHDSMKAKGATDAEIAEEFLASRSPAERSKLTADRGGKEDAIKSLVRRCTNLRSKRKRGC